MSEVKKSPAEEFVKAQEKVFQAWKEAMEEYSNTRVLEMYGEDTREAWNNCLELQEKAFSLWKETMQFFQPPFTVQGSPTEQVMLNYRRWWELQQKMLRAWRERYMSKDMYESYNFSNWASPDKLVRLYRDWMDMMQDGLKEYQHNRQAS